VNIEVLKEIIFNAGPLAALAAFAIWRLERVWQSRLDAEQRNVEIEQRYSKRLEGLYQQSLLVIQGNTQAMEANTAMTEALTDRIERLERLERA